MPRPPAARVAILAIVVLIGATACRGSDSTTSISPTDSTSELAPGPLSFTAEVLGGGQLDGSALAGQTVMLWFWAPT